MDAIAYVLMLILSVCRNRYHAVKLPPPKKKKFCLTAGLLLWNFHLKSAYSEDFIDRVCTRQNVRFFSPYADIRAYNTITNEKTFEFHISLGSPVNCANIAKRIELVGLLNENYPLVRLLSSRTQAFEKTTLYWASPSGSQRNATCICCWALAPAVCRQQLSIDIDPALCGAMSSKLAGCRCDCRSTGQTDGVWKCWTGKWRTMGMTVITFKLYSHGVYSSTLHTRITVLPTAELNHDDWFLYTFFICG